MKPHAVRSAWTEALPCLKCLSCASTRMELVSEDLIECDDCRRAYPLDDGIAAVTRCVSGNNHVAASFYDGPRWRKYSFWRRFTPFNDRAVGRWRAEVMQHLRNLGGTRLLDVAIGDGRNLPFIPANCDVYGVDVSLRQLQNCRQQHGDRRVWLFQGEAEQLPFCDHSFDNVLSFGAFNYFNDPLGTLREMARVVRPGGMIVITDEHADLPDRMIGSRIGLPIIDRWILSHVLHLGKDFTDMIDRHRNWKPEPIVDEVLQDWRISEVCGTHAYCVVGRPKSPVSARRPAA